MYSEIEPIVSSVPGGIQEIVELELSNISVDCVFMLLLFCIAFTDCCLIAKLIFIFVLCLAFAFACVDAFLSALFTSLF